MRRLSLISPLLLLILLLLSLLSLLSTGSKGDLQRSLEAFYAAERALLYEEESHKGPYHLREGLYYLYRALKREKQRGEIEEAFLKGEEIYSLMAKKGELRELTEELFYLLQYQLEDLLKKEEKSRD